MVYAAFDSGSTGVEGEFAPTSNVVVQIPESGIFNFTTVNIPSGATVTFTKNSQNTPVTMLATGDVTIAGTISVSGGNAVNTLQGVGGPGGFSGGPGGLIKQPGRRGDGPGSGAGGGACTNNDNYSAGGGGGSFGVAGGNGTGTSNCAPASVGGSAGDVYGNDRIVPVIGGSGGGGGGATQIYAGGAGGGGGGALVIASSGTVNIIGTISADGGNGAGTGIWTGGGGGGSGGSIRVIANTISGNGAITAKNGLKGGGGGTPGGDGGNGRIRLEANTFTRTALCTPAGTQSYASSVIPSNVPTLAITSVGGVSVPAYSQGSLGSPDIMLPYNIANTITVVVTAANVPANTIVTVKSAPQYGTSNQATGTLTGTDASSSASVQVTISKAYPSVLTASITFQLASLGNGPVYAQGERVEKVRVEAALGGESTITYITVSGKEIPAKQLKS